MDIDKAQKAFNSQKSGAKRRGIKWNLTFKEWCDFWGEDFHNRGSGHDKLCMQRFHDKGAYEIGNIKKGYPKENMRTMGNVRRGKLARIAKAEHEASLDAANVIPVDYEDEDESISAYFSKSGGYSAVNGLTFAIDKNR